MDGEYAIRMGNTNVGSVRVERHGLYYRFRCQCALSGDGMYRVVVCCNDHHENLGILMPMGRCFGLTAKLAAKRLGEGEPKFFALPKHQSYGAQFVPVYPEEPFSYLSRLKSAFLEIRNGQVGVIITDPE